MAEEAKIAPEVEAKETPAAEVKAEEAKVGDVLDTKSTPVVEKKEPKVVPEAVFLEEKAERKALAKELKEIKALIEDGASHKEVSGDIKDIAEEFGISEGAVQKLINKMGEKNQKEIEAALKPQLDAKKSEDNEKKFNDHFDKLIESMPEYKNLANREVIKTLAMDPKNANKTFAKILEESYGHLVTGKKTLERTQARGGNSDAPIDFKRASKDMEYFREIMANPELKKQYNESLTSRLRL